jgi:hypothetical protein
MQELTSTLSQLIQPLIAINKVGSYEYSENTAPNLKFNENYPFIWLDLRTITASGVILGPPNRYEITFRVWYLDQPTTLYNNEIDRQLYISKTLSKMHHIRALIETSWLNLIPNKPNIVYLDKENMHLGIAVTNDFNANLYGWVVDYKGYLLTTANECDYEELTNFNPYLCN